MALFVACRFSVTAVRRCVESGGGAARSLFLLGVLRKYSSVAVIQLVAHEEYTTCSQGEEQAGHPVPQPLWFVNIVWPSTLLGPLFSGMVPIFCTLHP